MLKAERKLYYQRQLRREKEMFDGCPIKRWTEQRRI
jgi:hypothetical protein